MQHLEPTEPTTNSGTPTLSVRSNRPPTPINIALLRTQGRRGAHHLARRLLGIQGHRYAEAMGCRHRRLLGIQGMDSTWGGPRWPDCFQWLRFSTEACDLMYALRDLGPDGIAAAEAVSGRREPHWLTNYLPREKLVAILEGESPLALGIAFAGSPPADNLDRFFKISGEILDKGLANGGYCTLNEILSIVPPEYTPALLDRLFDQMEALDITPMDDGELEAWLAAQC